MKKIAVVMSIYINDKIEYVSKAVDSILQQTFPDFDYYIQYDGIINNDVDKYLQSIADQRIKIYKRTDNKGLAQSLNDLLKIVLPLNYEFIARMDADDISLPQRFEEQIVYFQQHPKIECLGTWAEEIKYNGDTFFLKKMPITHHECYQLFQQRDCLIHPTVMFRHSFFEKAGRYDTTTFFAEDTMLWAQGFKAGCIFGNVPQYLYKFRLDEHFFDRRRGWKYAKGIWQTRVRVNKMLHFGISAYVGALLYATAKMMPQWLLNILYKTMR